MFYNIAMDKDNLKDKTARAAKSEPVSEKVSEDNLEPHSRINGSGDDVVVDARPSQKVADSDVEVQETKKSSAQDLADDSLNVSGSASDDGSIDGSADKMRDKKGDKNEDKMEGEPVDELTKLTEELHQSQDANLRLQAEIQNMHKRFAQELIKVRAGGLLDVAPVMLETLDNLENALGFVNSNKNAPKQEAGDASMLNGIKEGIELTYKTLLEGLKKFGIEEINPQDEKFDPEYHEALARVKIEGKAADMVVTVIQKGYAMDKRLLRAAKVQVAE